MPSTLIPDGLIERQSVAADAAVDAVAQMLDAQRTMLGAALDSVRLNFEALAHLTRSVIATVLELSDRGVTVSTRSVEQLSGSLTSTIASEPAGERANGSARKAKESVAA